MEAISYTKTNISFDNKVNIFEGAFELLELANQLFLELNICTFSKKVQVHTNKNITTISYQSPPEFADAKGTDALLLASKFI